MEIIEAIIRAETQAKKLPRVWTKASIQELLEVSDWAVMRAILAIYKGQTENEKQGKYTQVRNGIGFGLYDVEFYSNCAKQLLAGHSLSIRQLAIARPGMKRYWRQLVEVANENEAKKLQGRES